MPLPPKQSAVTSGRVPTEYEILKLAEQVSYVFGLPEAAGLKEQLRRDAEVYREWLLYQQHLKDEGHNLSLRSDEQGQRRSAFGVGAQPFLSDPETLSFLLAFFLTCPQMLSRPAGFEWVLQDLETVLVARRLNPETDLMCVEALSKARTKSRLGPPKNKALELFRYATIYQLMNPIPGVAAKMGRTRAVEVVAEIENRNFGGDAGVSSIWKAHKRAKQFFRQLSKDIQDKSLPPLTNKPDSEPQKRMKKIKKRMTQPPHRKRVRHK